MPTCESTPRSTLNRLRFERDRWGDGHLAHCVGGGWPDWRRNGLGRVIGLIGSPRSGGARRGGAHRTAPRASNESGLVLHRGHKARSSKLGREDRATCDGAWAAWAQAGVARSHVPSGCYQRWSPSPRWAAEPSRLPERQSGWAKHQATRWPPQVKASRCIRRLPSARGTGYSGLAC